MELRHLRYFVVVAEELSFRKAAKRLHIAAPPLGRQIRDLEEEIGTLLFDRSRNHVALTEAGKVFLAGTRKTLQAANQAVDAARKRLGQWRSAPCGSENSVLLRFHFCHRA